MNAEKRPRRSAQEALAGSGWGVRTTALAGALLVTILAGCAPQPVKVQTEVRTVEIQVPVRVPCLAAADVPAKPARALRPDADIRALAAGAAAELREWEGYFERADALLRGCAK